MPHYTPPLRDMQFVLHELLNVADELKALPAHAEIDVETINAVLEEAGQVRERSRRAAERDRRRRGLHPRPHDPRGPDPGRLQGRVREVRRRRLAGAQLRPGVRRPGAAAPAEPVLLRDAQFEQPGLDDVPGAVARRLRGAACARLGRAEGALPAEADQRRLDRHDVPDRAAVRHRPRPAAHQGRAAARRQLPAHRQQDLHLGRRARPGREHHPPGAGAPARCAGRLEGHFAVRRAEVQGQRRRQPRRAQRRSGAAASSTRWASTATRPRRSCSRAPTAGWSASRTRAWRRCS